MNELLGVCGKHYLASAATITGSFFAIKAVEAAVVTLMESNATGDALTNIPIAAGDVWYGSITSCTLVSGKIALYKSRQA